MLFGMAGSSDSGRARVNFSRFAVAVGAGVVVAMAATVVVAFTVAVAFTVVAGFFTGLAVFAA